MINLRFLVRYSRTVLDRPSNVEIVEREMYAPSWDAVEQAAAKLPRFLDIEVIQRLLPETAAEAAARVARENSGPVPRGC